MTLIKVPVRWGENTTEMEWRDWDILLVGVSSHYVYLGGLITVSHGGEQM